MVIHAVAVHTSGFCLLVYLYVDQPLYAYPCQTAVYRLTTLKFIVILSYCLSLYLSLFSVERRGHMHICDTIFPSQASWSKCFALQRHPWQSMYAVWLLSLLRLWQALAMDRRLESVMVHPVRAFGTLVTRDATVC